MIRALALISILMVVIIRSEVIEKNSEVSETQGIPDSSNFAIAINEDLIQEGQSSDIVVRAKRYYGCGCGCGCATVAAVSVAPCYGCCGCGYGK
uniref:Uncharacterized protein n=1 Tax=Caenorhabditis tropicalis TaxID=1561998 RepID=A0A1I7UPU7_9PELO